MTEKTQTRPSEPAKQTAKKAMPSKPDPQEAPVLSVGGSVNRDDGNGWVL
jgi:hypothetical protein